MDRLALFESLQRIHGSVAIAEWFLSNEDDDIAVVRELLGRADLIESRLAEIRGRLATPDNVHVLNRPDGDAA